MCVQRENESLECFGEGSFKERKGRGLFLIPLELTIKLSLLDVVKGLVISSLFLKLVKENKSSKIGNQLYRKEDDKVSWELKVKLLIMM